MARRGPRRLTVGSERFAWSTSHLHEDGKCREVVRLRRDGARGRLTVVFRSGDGHLAADGFPMHAGLVQHADGRRLNLNEPGVIRTLLDAAIACGWQADATTEFAGWALFDGQAQPTR